MVYLISLLVLVHSITNVVLSKECHYDDCPSEGTMVCSLDEKKTEYKMFVSECAFKAYSTCHSVELKRTPLKFCLKQVETIKRRMYGESCPTFCPSHYRPVCAMSKLRAYIYKSFNNGCYLDMVNCRGDEFNDYVEVPLSFCPGHLMKNIFKEQVIFSGLNDYRDYHEY
ncbi:hypothetical protein PYW08_004953 [Mythimna loreyi]|uniref:Uncharacterized protein n=1 Tax=Mythimna loreyi TaxID=667449 RepID=A0ACC2QGB8_9NEOP|nr:hypothetical protein PYW08_004953 [Mythimna loreyi]